MATCSSLVDVVWLSCVLAGPGPSHVGVCAGGCGGLEDVLTPMMHTVQSVGAARCNTQADGAHTSAKRCEQILDSL